MTQPRKKRKIQYFVPLDKITERAAEWIWKPWLPVGKLCLLDGDPGQGKSLITLDLAARISQGRSFPDRQRNALGPANVLLICCEDNLRDTVLPRLQSLGADLSRIFSYQSNSTKSIPNALPKFPRDFRKLESTLRRTKARFVIVDPLLPFLSASTNGITQQSVRKVLGPLAKMAERLQVTFLFVRLLNKTNGKTAIYRGSGSMSILSSMRSALLIGRHPHNPEKRILAPVKNNLTAEAQGLQFVLQSKAEAVNVKWEGKVNIRANELIGDFKSLPPTEWLRGFLSDKHFQSKKVYEAGLKAGYSSATLERAKATLGIKSKAKRHANGRIVWYWLPPGEKDFPWEEICELGFEHNPHD